MTEKLISTNLRKNFARRSPGGQVYTFESASVFSVPDLYLVAPEHRPVWVELKVVETDNCLIPFRMGQAQWIEDHWKAGGRAVVLVLVKRSRSFHCFTGAKCRTLKKLKVRQAEGHRLFISLAAEFGPDGWARLGRSLIQAATR